MLSVVRDLYSANETSHTQNNWSFGSILPNPTLPRTYPFCEKKILANWREYCLRSHSMQVWEYGIIYDSSKGIKGRKAKVRQCSQLHSVRHGVMQRLPFPHWLQVSHWQGWCCQKWKNFTPISPLINLWFPKLCPSCCHLCIDILFLVSIAFPFYVCPSCFGERKSKINRKLQFSLRVNLWRSSEPCDFITKCCWKSTTSWSCYHMAVCAVVTCSSILGF